jgi:O-antigen ligase
VSAELLARLAGPVAAGGLALLLVASPRWARLVGFAGSLVGMSLVVPLLVPARASGLLLAGGGLVALGLAVALAFLFQKQPWALPLLALLAAPARIPIPVGGETNNLLLPLYAVVGGATVSLGWSLWRSPPRSREFGVLSWPLAAFGSWIGLSMAWTNDPTRGAVEMLAFYLPFGLLALAIVRLDWDARAVTWLFRLLLAMAALFAAVGIGQWATRSVFWNPNLKADNTFATFYRVNSLFYDPSIYGRFLVVALLVALAVLVFGPWRRHDVLLTLTVALLWIGLFLSFSQSSFLALIVGVLVACVLRWRHGAPAVAGAAAVLALALGMAFSHPAGTRQALDSSSEQGLNRATRGRFDLVKNGLRIALDHPVVGVGVGGFTKAYRARVALPPRAKTPASHNTPVTVAAEAGIVGLGLFGWLVVTGALVPFSRTGARVPIVRVAGVASGLALTGIFVHSLFYNALFEDPLTWGFLAVATLAARRSGEANDPARV